MKIVQIAKMDAQEIRLREILEQAITDARNKVSQTEQAARANLYELKAKYFPQQESFTFSPHSSIPVLEVHDGYLVLVQHDRY